MTPREAASFYADYGLRVHPLRPASKRPLLPAWPQRATTESAAISTWWNEWPSAGVGIATGVASGVVAVDVDPRHGGDDALADLEREHSALPDTWRCRTAGGGVHLYFCHPGGTVPNRVGLRPGIDLRGDGGYVVAPPTILDGQRRYVWEIGYAPDDVSLADAPAWLRAEFIRPSVCRVEQGSPLLLRAGERNAGLFRIAAALRRHGVAEDAIRECLIAINRQHATPPLDASELAAIARSAARYEAAVHRARPFLRVPKS